MTHQIKLATLKITGSLDLDDNAIENVNKVTDLSTSLSDTSDLIDTLNTNVTNLTDIIDVQNNTLLSLSFDPTRTSTLTSATAGTVIYEEKFKTYYQYDGSNWKPLTFINYATLPNISWTQLNNDIKDATLTNNTHTSVSLSANGLICAVGTGKSGITWSRVRVYYNNNNTWNSIGEIDHRIMNNLYGYSISLNADGTKIAIGAPFVDGRGYVRISEYNGGSSWSTVGSNINGDIDISNDDRLGYSVSLNDDGTRVALGGIKGDHNGTNACGIALIYEWDGTSWNQLGNNIPGTNSNDRFGCSVSLNGNGNIVAIGASDYDSSGNGGINAGHVKIYEWNGTSWNQLGNDIEGSYGSDNFGYSVSISKNGYIVAIGGPNNNDGLTNKGHVKIYKWNGISWVQIGLDIVGDNAYDKFGYSVSLNGDGTIVSISAPRNDINSSGIGYVRTYQWNGTLWNKIENDIIGKNSNNQFGYSTAINSDGTIVAVGAVQNNTNGYASVHTIL